MRTAWTITGLIMAVLAHAQDPMGADWIMQELMENGQGGEAEELYASVTRHIEEPVDLNNCSREELEKTGIFTPFQVFAVMDQRERYGPFFSICELAAIPGINREFLKEIRLMITFSEEEEQPVTRQHIDGMLLTNVACRFPPASGLRNAAGEQPAYRGDPLKFTQRIRISHGDQLSLGAAFEKDPGEAWFNRKRPEHFTGYMAYTPGNFIEQLVAGNFRIHRGMGLVHRLGFSSRSTGNALNGYRRSYGKPFASTLEYDYFRGVYGSASMGKWDLDMFLSHTPADISFFRLTEKKDLFEMTRQTGLHRTTGESRGYDLARISSAGGSLNRSGKNNYAGCSFTGAHMQLTQPGTDSLKIVDPLRFTDPLKGFDSLKDSDSLKLADVLKFSDPLKSSRAAMSVYGVAFGTNYEVYGEVALDNTFQGAATIGGSLVVNPALSAGASLQRYSTGYRGAMPGTENSEDDEYNLRLRVQITPFRYGRMIVYHDLKVSGREARYTKPGIPEQYSIIECTWGRPNGPVIIFRYSGKTTREINAGNRPGTGSLTGQQNHHFRIHYRWAPVESVILQGRIEISMQCDGHIDGIVSAIEPATFPGKGREAVPEEKAETEPGPGLITMSGIKPRPGHNAGSMAYQQVQWIPRQGIRITYRYLLFDVGDWENRIYSHEPGVKYSFLFPSWAGKGSRNVLVFSTKIGRRITLRGKYGLTVYAHRWETGSGNDVRKGNRLTDMEFQVQVDLY
ncbi:MAG: hypothetical protein P1P82_02365 [Bacteroidales bacterium]|nr:hypothetical protein [Bacteroidales bacterium]MDT8431110.1 hypothetical protein [Bacteroidales bacterium]